jgi:hypothetical protein
LVASDPVREHGPWAVAGLKVATPCGDPTRCHASVETITRALTGHYRAEHLFALEQALAFYDAYQEKASACDARIEAAGG